MKLELKHLAPYLPYDLMCEVKDQGKTKHAKLSGAYIDNSYAFFDTVESEHGYDSIKPILRPLSDLQKLITINDEIFIPLNWIFGEDWSDAHSNPLFWQYGNTKKLFEWHFDVFGLIPEGLAIDINTL